MVDRPNKPGALAVSRDITHATGVSIESDRVKVAWNPIGSFLPRRAILT